MWSNNGVVAVVSEPVFQEMEHRLRIESEAKEQRQELRLPLPRPVFTFANADSGLREWVTGTYEDMKVLLEGHNVVREPMYVPFSNGYQWDTGVSLAEMERGFRTTLRQAMDAFGLVPKHLIEAGVR